MSPLNVCKVCGVEPEFGRLHVCQMCHSRLCDLHQYKRAGKVFCDKKCAEEFFFAEPEEGEED